MEDPPPGFFRLAPGREVRLRYAYFLRCEEVVKDPATGEVVELRCTYDPATKGGNAPDGRKVKGTLHWVSAPHAVKAEVRLFDRLFTINDPEGEEGRDFTEFLNPESRMVVTEALVEPSVASAPLGTRYQFGRRGYFMTDEEDSTAEAPVFNRIVTLRDTWGKRMAAEAGNLVLEGSDAEMAQTGGQGSAELQKEAATLKPRRDRRNLAREAREEARAGQPELAAAYVRYQEELGLPEEDADLLTGSAELSGFFEVGIGAGDPAPSPTGLANWIVNELVRELKDRPLADVPITPQSFAALVALREGDAISQPVAKEVFSEMVTVGGDPVEIVKAKGLDKMVDIETLKALIDRTLRDNPTKVDEYRAGKKGLLGFFMGQIMKETGGKADPQAVQTLIRQSLEG